MNKIFVEKVLYSFNDEEMISTLIDLCNKAGPEYVKFKLRVSAFCENVDLIAIRPETDLEFEKRKKFEKEQRKKQKEKQEQKMFEQYQELKKKFEGV